MNESEYRAEWLSARRAPSSWAIITADEVADAKRSFEKLIAERDELRAEVERLKADKSKILEIVAREVALEDKDRPGDCRAIHNRANNISDAITALAKIKNIEI